MPEPPEMSDGRPFSKPADVAFRAISAVHTFLYRLTGGKLGARLAKSPVLLLETVGRKSGKRRTRPLLYLPDDDRLVIVASKGGAPRDPDWWRNLKAKPRTTVQVGRRRIAVEAEEARGPERERLWPLLTAMYPSYAEYQKKTTREIPVVVLRPTGP